MLADVVRVVRMTRPLVITSVFVGGPSDGHGHHAVAGQMAQEAFDAAGDPNMFPEQIRAGLRPWSPLKMYARMPLGSRDRQGHVRFRHRNYLPVRFYDFIDKKWADGVPAINVANSRGNYRSGARRDLSCKSRARDWRCRSRRTAAATFRSPDRHQRLITATPR